MMLNSETQEWPDPELAILIPAAGLGTRLGLGPKAWLKIGEYSLLKCLVSKAMKVAGTVVVAGPPGGQQKIIELCPGCSVIEGGATRQDTIRLLTQANQLPWLMIHDAARPFVSIELLRLVAKTAKQCGGVAAAFLDPEVPVALLENGWATTYYTSKNVGIFQAPQAFSRKILEQALEASDAAGWVAQSTLQLVMNSKFRVRAVPGEKTNIKLTTPADWKMAEGMESLL